MLHHFIKNRYQHFAMTITFMQGNFQFLRGESGRCGRINICHFKLWMIF